MGRVKAFLLSLSVSVSVFAYTSRPGGNVQAFVFTFDVDIAKCEKEFRAMKPNPPHYPQGYGSCDIFECETKDPHLSFERVVKRFSYPEGSDGKTEHKVLIAAGASNTMRGCGYDVLYIPPSGMDSSWPAAKPFIEKAISELPGKQIEIPVLKIVP